METMESVHKYDGHFINENRQLVVNMSGNFNNTTIAHAEFTTDHTYETVARVLDTIVTPVICGFGCIGNIVNMIVLIRMRGRKLEGTQESGAHLGLICLAVSDMFFCITLFPRAFISTKHSFFEAKDFWLYYQAYHVGVSTWFILVSTWLTVTMATMRYFGICHPFCARSFDSFKCSKVSYCLVLVLCTILNMPMFWVYEIKELPLGGKVISYYIDNGFFKDTSIQGIIYIWLKAILGIFIPAVILTFCNFSLIRTLRKSYRMRQQFHVQQTSGLSHRITLTLIIIVMMFILCVYPSELMDFFGEIIRNNQSKTEVFLMWRSIANILQVVNFAFNFVLYCVINVHFRSILTGAFSYACNVDRCGCGHREENYVNILRRFSKTASTYVTTHPRHGHVVHMT